MEKNEDKKVLNLSVKPFITAIAILLGLMVLTYILTFVLPGGQFTREIVDGRETILPGSYATTEAGLPFWKFLASPFLSLGDSNGGTVISVCLLLLIIGGAFNILDEHGVLRYTLSRIHGSFKDRKYQLLPITALAFMTLGALAGSFEEVIPLVPITVALAYTLGWDAMVGMGMSLLAVGCGFATGVCNIFTVGAAQKIAQLPLFSGIGMRILSFIIVYIILMLMLIPYAKKVEKNPQISPTYSPEAAEHWREISTSVEHSPRMDRATVCFGVILASMVVSIIIATFVPFLQDFITIIVLAEFLLAGIVTVLIGGMKIGALLKAFGKGILNMLPGVGLILMASAVRYILTEGKILDTILNGILQLTAGASPMVIVLVIYLLVLIMNFFIASGSAKAFLLMPLIIPLADFSSVPRQMAILAFAYGDGFSNVFYPTNAALLISLSLIGISYVKWAKWSFKYQIVILTVTTLLLLFAMAIGYGR